jgi:arabinan endo-1,5-alpha-L-arabinosidase
VTFFASAMMVRGGGRALPSFDWPHSLNGHSRGRSTTLHFVALFAIFALTGACARGTSVLAAPSAGAVRTYTNPVLDQDFPDPTVIRAADGAYYAYATQGEARRSQADSTLDFLNLQVLRTSDLVHWTRLGDALPVKPTWASRTRDFWAPHVSERAGRYFMYYSAKPDAALGDSTRGLCLAVATASSPAGPFTDMGHPLQCGPGFVNIDPMQLDDPLTGQPLLYWGSGFGPIKVQPLASDRMSFAAGTSPTPLVHPAPDSTRYERLVEGAWVTYRAPWFYLFYSGDACCGPRAHYAVLVARSRSATGPFEKMADATGRPRSAIVESTASWFAPGHNSVLRDANGDDWMFYHAVDPRRSRRPASSQPNTRRVMLVDRIVYRDGWPALESGGPSSTPQSAPVP